MTNIAVTLKSIGFQKVLKIGKLSEEQSRTQNISFSTLKSRKLQTKSKVHESLWIRSTNKSYQSLKLSSTMTNLAWKSMIFGMCFIVPSTLLNIIALMKVSSKKYYHFPSSLELSFQRKNSSSLSLSIIILPLLTLINFYGIISSIFSKIRHV